MARHTGSAFTFMLDYFPPIPPQLQASPEGNKINVFGVIPGYES